MVAGSAAICPIVACVGGKVGGVSGCAVTPVGADAAVGVFFIGGSGANSLAISSAAAAYSAAAAIASGDEAAVAAASVVGW